jgi:hydroxyproline O-arabinosyltransferase
LAPRAPVFILISLDLDQQVISVGTSHHFSETQSTANADSTSTSADAQAGSTATATSSRADSWSMKGNTVHVLATSNGSPYCNFQSRILHHTFKAAVKQPGGSAMVAFTRILHRTVPDALMGEMTTFRADPLQPKCDGWCEYPVSDRPNAVRQFLDAAKKDPSMIKVGFLFVGFSVFGKYIKYWSF